MSPVPDPDRLVTLPNSLAAPEPGWNWWPTKAPGDAAIYWLDCTQALADDEGFLVQAEAQITAGDDTLVVGEPVTSGSAVGLPLSGGTSGSRYTVLFSLFSSGGDRITQDVSLSVWGSSAPPPVVSAQALIINGFALTIAGAPLTIGG